MSTNGEHSDYPDKLIVTGVPRMDGEYPCNVVGMLLEGTPHTLTNREGHQIKVMTGVRAGELWGAMESGDNDVVIALAAIVLARAGKRVDTDTLWDSPMGSALAFDIAEREGEGDEADDANPPAPTPITKKPDSDGGPTTSPVMLGQPENDPSGIGIPAYFPSDPVTSEN